MGHRYTLNLRFVSDAAHGLNELRRLALVQLASKRFDINGNTLGRIITAASSLGVPLYRGVLVHQIHAMI
jgi:hypothetical protein